MQSFEMVDVCEKEITHRSARAVGRIYMSEEAFRLIQQNQLPKGNPLPMAETAGILAVKKTAEILPLCHPLALEKIKLQFDLDEEAYAIQVECTVSAHEKTGVEMEALMGVQVALLTIYDLTKPLCPALTISEVRLKSKQGGKKGLWVHPHFSAEESSSTPEHFNNTPSFSDIEVAVLTISDRASQGKYPDLAGEELKRIVRVWGASIVDHSIVPDEKKEITTKIVNYTDELRVNLILTTGGTGISKRDNTPEVVASLSDRLLPGFGELIRRSGASFTPYAWLSRAIAGIRKNTLIVTLPGSPKAVKEGLEALKTLLLHALQQLATTPQSA